ncbi:NADH:ubiquinone oxidoreductase 24 kD subunit [Candidatus Methanoperedens nitroreducens]|uniref:NADH:ubiquinone oxidoreductase 24 kD subunit n=1 Tax=Candidatus Methanoperedens nitratireducens TaxID=1392998 RepID=A0A062V4P6_9EURY|nr:NAD(P)H-dependent oxidoreductase subunit E [Candidatus Methanoperedens nitroreducens]KCZ71573.1 NADH:ubiquinone oxidoreductase 24 kD subunit [Candidatus Methanoperedens nitroreducens]MDJ1421201.1 NAD(P)H-dependent oxidoreductase subunit E [Candidatus Methanoperedens sp.]
MRKKNQTTFEGSRVDPIIDKYNAEQGSLISILQDIQAEYRYLPREALEHVARRLNIPVVQAFGVATFFRAFTLEPRGRQLIHVCMGTACHVRGSQNVLEEVERKLEIKAGGTTPDGEYTLETVNCVGACALGPVVIRNEEYLSHMTPTKVSGLLKKV